MVVAAVSRGASLLALALPEVFQIRSGPLKTIIIELSVPDEYADVHPDIVLEDFLKSPADPAWSPCVVGSR